MTINDNIKQIKKTKSNYLLKTKTIKRLFVFNYFKVIYYVL